MVKTEQQRQFEKLLETYRFLGVKLGYPNGEWETIIDRHRLEEVEKALPEIIKLAIEAYVLLDGAKIEPELKKSGQNCMQDMWLVVQINQIAIVMKRDLTDWVTLLRRKNKKNEDERIKDKIDESRWRLERVFRHFRLKTKDDKTDDKSSKTKEDKLILTYFVQEGIRLLSHEENFNYDELMSKCEYMLCLLRRLQHFVSLLKTTLTREERCIMYDLIYLSRRCLGFDAREALKMLPAIEQAYFNLKPDKHIHGHSIPPELVLDPFKAEVDQRMNDAQEKLHQMHATKQQMRHCFEQLKEWTYEEFQKDWSLPLTTEDKQTIGFGLLPECGS